MTAAPAKMKSKRLTQWFGSDVAVVAQIGRELGKLKKCGIPFAGGMSVVPYIDAPRGIANDLHRHIINLARVISSDAGRIGLKLRLESRLYHPDELADAQHRCLERELTFGVALFGSISTQENVLEFENSLDWAADYFIACWLGMGGHSGKRTEFNQNLSVRWNSGGGDSCGRFRTAIDVLDDWHRVLRPWSFTTLDALVFLDEWEDAPGHGLYVDAPWPGAGAEYKHRFDDTQQIRLHDRLAEMKHTRIVIRFNDHPLIRQIYKQPRWHWIENTTRNQQNKAVREVLILSGPSLGQTASTEDS